MLFTLHIKYLYFESFSLIFQCIKLNLLPTVVVNYCATCNEMLTALIIIKNKNRVSWYVESEGKHGPLCFGCTNA